jgi:hypothetical protein
MQRHRESMLGAAGEHAFAVIFAQYSPLFTIRESMAPVRSPTHECNPISGQLTFF